MVDHATRYAERVVAGRVVASNRVRQVCAQHLADLQRDDLPYWWDPQRANHALKFFRRLRIPEGVDEGKPFRPFPWECFLIGMVFGWLQRHPDYPSLVVRRYNEVLLQTGRGAGKSPLLAGFMLYLLLEDFWLDDGKMVREPSPYIPLVAAKSEQAEITWKFLRNMVAWTKNTNLLTHYLEQDGRLLKRPEPVILDFKGGKAVRGAKYLYAHHGDLNTEPFGVVILVSAEASGRGATGSNPSAVLGDEYHDFISKGLLDRLQSGRKQRRQPLMLLFTNSGASDATPYGKDYTRDCKVLDGKLPPEPRRLVLLYECDEGDDPFAAAKNGRFIVKRPRMWLKMNPSLEHGYPGYASIHRDVTEALRDPEAWARVARFQFCMWTRTARPWLKPEVIKKAWRDVLSPAEDRATRDCFVTVDAGVSRSLGAICFLWDFEEWLEAEVTCWGNFEYLEPKSVALNIPFDEWFQSEELIECAGNIEIEAMGAWLIPRLRANRVRGLAMDTFGKPELTTFISEVGRIRVIDGEEPPPYRKGGLYVWHHAQGFTTNQAKYEERRGLWMTASIAAAENEFAAERLRILETRPVEYGLEVAQIERKGKLAVFHKENPDLPNDPALVIAEAVGLYKFFNINKKRESTLAAAKAAYEKIRAKRRAAAGF